MESKNVVLDLVHWFNKYTKDNLAITPDNNYFFVNMNLPFNPNSLFRLIFDDTFKSITSPPSYEYGIELINKQNLASSELRDRTLTYPEISLYKVHYDFFGFEVGTICGGVLVDLANCLDITLEEEALFDKLLEYRETGTTNLSIIIINDSPQTQITYNDLVSERSKAIYIYLDLYVNDNLNQDAYSLDLEDCCFELCLYIWLLNEIYNYYKNNISQLTPEDPGCMI